MYQKLLRVWNTQHVAPITMMISSSVVIYACQFVDKGIAILSFQNWVISLSGTTD